MLGPCRLQVRRHKSFVRRFKESSVRSSSTAAILELKLSAEYMRSKSNTLYLISV